MKTLFLHLILFSTLVFSQPEFIGELSVLLINKGTSWDVTILLTAVSARWDEDYLLTEDYETVSIELTSPFNYYADFDHIVDPNGQPVFARGLYKISAVVDGSEKARFYMDWRTSGWTESLDVYFKYDIGNQVFIDWDETQSINKTYQTLWNLTNNPLITSELENYWSNTLAVTKDPDNHPRLVWGPYPEEIGVTQYRVYRKYDNQSFTLWRTVSGYTTTDESVPMYENQVGGILTQYYVKGVYIADTETPASNTVVVNTGQGIEKENIDIIKESINYCLLQNFPNPFNPTTKIIWQMPEENFVKLKIFNLLGQEVASLVNENMKVGRHEVEFNASDLPSGIYLYKIQIGQFEQTRKLILQK